MVEFPGAPPTRSYSSFSTWLSCGKQWQLSRMFKVPEVPAWYFIGGHAVHRVSELFDHELEAQGAGN